MMPLGSHAHGRVLVTTLRLFLNICHNIWNIWICRQRIVHHIRKDTGCFPMPLRPCSLPNSVLCLGGLLSYLTHRSQTPNMPRKWACWSCLDLAVHLEQGLGLPRNSCMATNVLLPVFLPRCLLQRENGMLITPTVHKKFWNRTTNI